MNSLIEKQMIRSIYGLELKLLIATSLTSTKFLIQMINFSVLL